MKTLFLLFLWTSIKFATSAIDFRSTVVYITTEVNNISNVGTARKHDLRYGFHQIADCASFEKSFLCIQKCVDWNYDVAHADKDCKCTCYVKKDREKYKSVSSATRTRWRSGAPKTSVPPWAGGVPAISKQEEEKEEKEEEEKEEEEKEEEDYIVTENYNLGSSEEGEELKGVVSTNRSNVEEILKDEITTGDGSNSTASAVTAVDVTNANNSDTDNVANTSMSTSLTEEAVGSEE